MNGGAYPRGLIIVIKKSASKQAMAMPIKIRFAFTCYYRLKNPIINRIHFNAS